VETQDTLALLNAVRTLWKELPRGQVLAVGVTLGGLVPLRIAFTRIPDKSEL
jgi:hypothetical protein